MRSRPLFVDSGFVFIDEVGRALHPNCPYGRVQNSIGAGGALTAIHGAPFKAGRGPIMLTIDSAGFVYVSNEGSGNISGFARNSGSGALKKVDGSPFLDGTAPFGVVTW